MAEFLRLQTTQLPPALAAEEMTQLIVDQEERSGSVATFSDCERGGDRERKSDRQSFLCASGRADFCRTECNFPPAASKVFNLETVTGAHEAAVVAVVSEEVERLH
ncbi:unnamed protein product [Pleuronectes platessa]|uniref:Uncharacterized protein n=1 Tax=Pleuronectes platessa TaxID=8262 RepID=A0A9N7UCH5_PLEPL|nr:unnamed protein product [Pleuronectes platessa]